MTLTTICNTSSTTLSLEDLRHANIEHYGLILIFPYSGTPREACIVHHPAQNESEVKSNINSFIEETENPPPLSISLLKGTQPMDCEFGLYMLMYAYIADNTNSFETFSDSVNQAHDHSDLDDKLREWLFIKYTQDDRTKYVPFWLDYACSHTWLIILNKWKRIPMFLYCEDFISALIPGFGWSSMGLYLPSPSPLVLYLCGKLKNSSNF